MAIDGPQPDSARTDGQVTGITRADFVGSGTVETGTVETGAVESGAVEAGAVETGAVETGTVETDSPRTGAASPGSSAQPVAAVERRLEAILMVAEEPQSVIGLATALDVPVRQVRVAIERLVADLDGADGGTRRGFELREVGGGWRFYVRVEFDDLVRDFVSAQTTSKLSQAALETLAVIAYKQPISRGSVASIRAVNVDSVVRTLLGRGLIAEAFVDSETGAIHYATTDLLLTQLGINSIDELPHISPLLSDGIDDELSDGPGRNGSFDAR